MSSYEYVPSVVRATAPRFQPLEFAQAPSFKCLGGRKAMERVGLYDVM